MIIDFAGLFQPNSDRFGPLIHRRSVLPGQGKNKLEAVLPSHTKPLGLGPPSPAVGERGFELNALQPLSRPAGEGDERSEAGEGLTVAGYQSHLIIILERLHLLDENSCRRRRS